MKFTSKAFLIYTYLLLAALMPAAYGQATAPTEGVDTATPRNPRVPGTPANRLDAKGKAIYYKRRTLNYQVFGVMVMLAGIQQFNGTPPEWTGMEGYGRRLGDQLATTGITVGTSYALSSLMHIDPRYYRCHGCSFWGHLKSASVQTVMSHTDGGRWVPDLPRLGGVYGGSMLSMYWYPDRYSPLSDGVRRGNYALVSRYGLSLLREFLPAKMAKFMYTRAADKYDDQ
jgi:hypothetical protein